MTIEEQIEVMNHFKNGGEVEIENLKGEWVDCDNPEWDWSCLRYRIKPEPEPQNLEDRIKAEYPEYEVKVLFWEEGMLQFDHTCTLNGFMHVLAQSIKGFAGYVYFKTDEKGNNIDEIYQHRIYSPISYEGNHPVAVLFTKDSKEEA